MRGELWTVAGGVYASKPRPALIVQDDAFDDTDSVTVLPLTSTAVDASLLRLTVTPTASNGLEHRSWIQIDKVTTVRRTSLGHRIGKLDQVSMLDVERHLAAFLGFGRPAR